jgi:hypothetical protein
MSVLFSPEGAGQLAFRGVKPSNSPSRAFSYMSRLFAVVPGRAFRRMAGNASTHVSHF